MSSYQTPNPSKYYATPAQTGGPPPPLAYPPSCTFQPGPPPRSRPPHHPAASYPTPTPLPQRWTPLTSRNMNMTPGSGGVDMTPFSSVTRLHIHPNHYPQIQSGNGLVGYASTNPNPHDNFVTPLKHQHYLPHPPSPTPNCTPMMQMTTMAPLVTPANPTTNSQSSAELPSTATPPDSPSTVDTSLSSNDLPNPFIDGVFQLSGLQIPAPFPGPYPLSYINQDPLLDNDTPAPIPLSELRRSNRQGSASVNPWDYITLEYETKEGEGGRSKVRRRFTKRELEMLEVLWSTARAPTKFQRQRLGAWLGVKTKHITVWFQNRRQEEKRHSREGPTDPQLSSRSNRGTYDPVTGKWRPVPLSCISSLQPPPPEKLAAVLAISLGEITREGWFEKNPSANEGINGPGPSAVPASQPSTLAPSRMGLTRTHSSSLDDVLRARENGFGCKTRMTRVLSESDGQLRYRGEGEERKREMLAMMPSDPPSMDLMELRGEDEDVSEEGESELSSNEEKPVSRAKPGEYSLGRATSLDVIASSSRAKQLVLPLPRSITSQNMPSLQISYGSTKHTIPAPPVHSDAPAKRPRLASSGASLLPRPNPLLRPRDSFSRSQSHAVLQPSSPNMQLSGGLARTQSDVHLKVGGRFWQDKEDKENQPSGPKLKKSAAEDAEVLDAASSLLDMLCGASR